MVLPFLNTKVKDLLRKLKPCGQCCLTPYLVSPLWVLAVICPNTEVRERRVHRSSLSGLGQGCSVLATVSTVVSFLSSAWETCTGPSRCFQQTLPFMDIEHLEWKDVPCCWAVEVCLRLGSGWESEDYRVLNVSFFKVTAAQKGWLGKKNVPLAKNPCPSWLLCWWIWLPENHRVPPRWLELLITCFHISTANVIYNLWYMSPCPPFMCLLCILFPKELRGRIWIFPSGTSYSTPTTIRAIRCVSSRKMSTASQILHDGTYSTYQMTSNMPGTTGSNIAKWKLHELHTCFERMTWTLTFPLWTWVNTSVKWG